ncbi:hypothetical protein ACN42_g1198 [Penicillium freii]|uniref:Uncharacterized protein n=1 Tax=Penicillium freii TaxID=48697 RepID=A0A101MSE9_PENFR|nr:hypothetical protein ACN42_g1198 [Penicillium freii]
MIHILIEQEPSETLTRAEVMILTATMITRLEGEDCLEYDTIPVMAIMIFGQMKARVIEAHCTPIWTFCLDLCVPTPSKMIEPTVPTKTPKVCNIDTVDLGKVPDGSW